MLREHPPKYRILQAASLGPHHIPVTRPLMKHWQMGPVPILAELPSTTMPTYPQLPPGFDKPTWLHDSSPPSPRRQQDPKPKPPGMNPEQQAMIKRAMDQRMQMKLAKPWSLKTKNSNSNSNNDNSTDEKEVKFRSDNKPAEGLGATSLGPIQQLPVRFSTESPAGPSRAQNQAMLSALPLLPRPFMVTPPDDPWRTHACISPYTFSSQKAEKFEEHIHMRILDLEALKRGCSDHITHLQAEVIDTPEHAPKIEHLTAILRRAEAELDEIHQSSTAKKSPPTAEEKAKETQSTTAVKTTSSEVASESKCDDDNIPIMGTFRTLPSGETCLVSLSENSETGRHTDVAGDVELDAPLRCLDTLGEHAVEAVKARYARILSAEKMTKERIDLIDEDRPLRELHLAKMGQCCSPKNKTDDKVMEERQRWVELHELYLALKSDMQEQHESLKSTHDSPQSTVIKKVVQWRRHDPAELEAKQIHAQREVEIQQRRDATVKARQKHLQAQHELHVASAEKKQKEHAQRLSESEQKMALAEARQKQVQKVKMQWQIEQEEVARKIEESQIGETILDLEYQVVMKQDSCGQTEQNEDEEDLIDDSWSVVSNAGSDAAPVVTWVGSVLESRLGAF